jgi:hypothetical protein
MDEEIRRPTDYHDGFAQPPAASLTASASASIGKQGVHYLGGCVPAYVPFTQ